VAREFCWIIREAFSDALDDAQWHLGPFRSCQSLGRKVKLIVLWLGAHKEKQCRESLAVRAGKSHLVRLWARLKGLVKALRTIYGLMVGELGVRRSVGNDEVGLGSQCSCPACAVRALSCLGFRLWHCSWYKACTNVLRHSWALSLSSFEVRLKCLMFWVLVSGNVKMFSGTPRP
jgi:ribosomal protein L37AE/L43A